MILYKDAASVQKVAQSKSLGQARAAHSWRLAENKCKCTPISPTTKNSAHFHLPILSTSWTRGTGVCFLHRVLGCSETKAIFAVPVDECREGPNIDAPLIALIRSMLCQEKKEIPSVGRERFKNN